MIGIKSNSKQVSKHLLFKCDNVTNQLVTMGWKEF